MSRVESLELNSDIFFVQGSRNSAIYDTTRGNVYSINQAGSQVIAGTQTHQEYKSQLYELGLMEKSTTPTVHTFDTEKWKSPPLRHAWLEIEDHCPERCVHCYGRFGHTPVAKKDRLSHEEWKTILEDVYALDARSVQFTGGEIFTYGKSEKDVLDLVLHARQLGFEDIELFTNGILLTEKKARRIKELGDIHVAVSLYSTDESVHDSVTQLPGSFRKTMRAIHLLQENEIPFRVGFIVMKQNQDTVEETIETLRKLGVRRTNPDIVRPSGRASDSDIEPEKEVTQKYGLMIKPDFRTNRHDFERYHFLNPCLAGKITITVIGQVIPCIFDRDNILGQIRNQPLTEIVNSEKTQAIWHTTKDDVLVCQDCEYRYSCGDCRPLSVSTNVGGGYDSPPARCTYNPYTGEWGQGVWRLKDDQPIYIPLEDVNNKSK